MNSAQPSVARIDWLDSLTFRSMLSTALCLTALWIVAPASRAATEVVTSIAPFSGSPTPGVWYANDIRFAGSATIESLVGLGGNLETNAPLPTGSVLLTTTSDNADKAEIGIPDDFGLAGDILDGTFELSYGYYKESSGNAFAAPAIKLVFFHFDSPCPSPSGDCFVTLVYEPTWNQPGFEGSSVAVPTGDWQSITITNTSGLLWGTGGFGEPNTAGGPPLRTLDEWLTAFDSSFAGATLVSISVGVGTFNQDQIGWFDDVSLVTDGPFDTTWDFEVPAPPPGVFVDLYHSSQPASPVQAGYVGVDAADAGDGSPVAVGGLLVSLASAGVQSGGSGLSGRDRGALALSQAQSDLARDFAFAWGEELVLTIEGLDAGIYEWTGYFHDRNLDQGDATVSLSVDGGTTYLFGPESFAHSTGADPASIATQSILFAADGISSVVVRIANPDLPTPSVRPILDGFDLVPADPVQGVYVDWYHASQGVSPVQAGYVGADAADAADGSPVSVGPLTLGLASAGSEVGGSGISGRDRGALDASQPLSDLARDFAFAFGEELVMTIGGVARGTYLLTGYFHDNNVDHGGATLQLSVDGGSTYPTGPDAFLHSTGANPPAIATQSVLFQVTGEEGPVVVRIANSDLPAPAVRPILDGFDLELLDSPGVYVDLYHSSQGVSPVQAGFAGVDAADASDGTPVVVGSILVSLASGGIETDGTGLEGRDRGALDPGQARSDLARDFAFAWGEDLLLTLENVEAGRYWLMGYFHDNTVDQGAAEMSVSVDGGATYPYAAVPYVHSTTADPLSVATQGVAFDANGVDPVVVRISNPDLPTPSVRPILNGFVMVPEPTGALGLAAGIGVLVGLARRRSRRT